MKLKFIALSLFLALFVSSCNAVDDLLTFNISNQTTIEIKNTSPLNLPTEIVTPDVTTNSSTEFKNNNTNTDLIKDVKLKSLQLTIESPEGKTFTFLKSVRLYISTSDSNEIELAYLDNISSSANSIDLICTDKRLDEYIKNDSYKIRTQVTIKETLTQDVSMKASMKFAVTADPF